MRCRLCEIAVRHVKPNIIVTEFYCKACIIVCDLDIRYLVPSDELAINLRPDTRWLVKRKAKLQGL